MPDIAAPDMRVSIERQAREWLIRMDGDEELSGAERQALREWMSRSAAHREELLRISRLWSQANVLTALAGCLESGRPNRVVRYTRWAATIVVTASVVLASVLVLRWNQQRVDAAANRTYETAIGEQREISLPDGSMIQLNTNSRVQVAYLRERRSIRLLSGEALFSVMPDPVRPFEVYAADEVVRAVGTAFDIHLEGSKVDVTVTTGVVDVARARTAQTASSDKPPEVASQRSSLGQLKAGEMTRLAGATDRLNVRRLAEPELQRRMAWQQGYLAFSGEPLSEVVEQVNRYSPVKVEIGDPVLMSIAVGGRFRIGDLDAVLDALETNFGIRAHRFDEYNITLERVPNR